MGISYGGISQLFVAATDPPDLAAIAPLSTIDNTATTLYPGGILNTGFALAWARQRAAGRPAGLDPPAVSRGRCKQIQDGDHDLQAGPGAPRRGAQPDRQGPRQRPLRAVGRRPADADHVRAQDPRAHVSRLPVDRRADRRRTAPTSPSTSRARAHKWFTFTNGDHIDSLDPDTFDRWYDFLELYVARQAPHLRPRSEPVWRRPSTAARWASAASRSRPTRSTRSPPTPARWRRSRSSSRSGSCSTTAPAADKAPAPRTPHSRPRSRASRSPAPRRAPGTSRARARWQRRQARHRCGRSVHLEQARPARHRLHRQHAAAAGCGARRRAITGTRARPARRPPT